jgi:hypothetical protein
VAGTTSEAKVSRQRRKVVDDVCDVDADADEKANPLVESLTVGE